MMDKMEIFFFLPPAGVVLLFVILSFTLGKKGIYLNGETRQTLKLIFLCFVGVSVWYIFFEDREMIFECRKKTMTCTYYHSTIADKTIRLVKAYDISNISGVKLTKHTKRSGKYSRKTYYKIRFVTGEHSFEMPHEFDIESFAAEEGNKINRFLATPQPVYRYEKKAYSASDRILLIMIGALGVILLGGTASAALVIEWKKSRKKRIKHI